MAWTRLNGLLGFAAALLLVATSSAHAQGDTRTFVGEVYVPTVWVDPDGCEHWVMDDGWEGFMTPHVDRNGIPVCNRGKTCAVMNSDVLFASGSHQVSAKGRAWLRSFFAKTPASGYVIAGHTDSRASDAYNMQLSLHRANAVARIAVAFGVRVADVRGYGERRPVASNTTVQGRQLNRRVEILCVR
ncbi:MAG: OmpA family protein [Pseudomonadota bacterium]